MRFTLHSRSVPGCSTGLLAGLLLAIVHPALSPAQGAVTHREVLRSGHIFPEAPDLMVQKFFGSTPFQTQESLNARGDVLCILPLVPIIGSPTMEIQGLVFYHDGTLELLAKTGDPMPGATSGETILTFGQPALNNDGRVGVIVTDSNYNQAVLSWKNNVWNVVVRSGDPAPGLAGHAFVSFAAPTLDGPIMRHDAAFNYLVEGRTRDGQNNNKWGIWNLPLPPEPPQLVLVRDEPAPDEGQLGTGSILSGVSSVQYASPPFSTLLIKGFLDPYTGPADFTNNVVLWLGPADDLRVLLRTGVTPPAELTSELGEIFFTSIDDTSINGAEDVSVAASWVGPAGSDSGLLRFNGTTWQVAARKGDPVTGLEGNPAGVFSYFGKARINAAGQIGFLANVDATATGGGFLPALFRWDPVTGVKMLARQGTGDWPVLLGSWLPGDFAINAAGQAAIYAANPITSIPRAIYTATTGDALQLVACKEPSLPPVVGELRVWQLPAQLGGTSGGEDGRRRVFNDLGDLLYPVEYSDGFDPGESAFVISHADYGWFSTTGLNDATWFPIDGPQIDVSGLIFDALEQPFGWWEATTGAPENWAGGSVRFQITQGFGVNDTLELIYAATDDATIDGLGAIKASDGRLIGNLSRPAPNSLQVDFAATTLAADVANILSRVVFGTRFMAQLHVDVRHLEPPRNLRAIISPAGGPSETNDLQVSFPSYVRHQIEPNPQQGRVHLNLYLIFHWADGTSSHASSAYQQLASTSWEFDPGTNAVTIPIAQTSSGNPAFGLQVKSVTVDRRWDTPIALFFLDASNEGIVTFEKARDYPDCPALSTDSSIYYLREAIQSARRIRMNNQDASGVIPLYYALREALKRSPEGRRLVGLYYANGPEIVRLMIENPDLIEAAGQILDAFAGLVNVYVSGNGQTLTIDAQLISQLNQFAEQIIASASPELTAAIDDERARFNNLQDFIGKTMVEWGQMLAVGAPDVPLVALSLPVKLENGFQAQANRIAGFTYSLWRTMDPAGANWEEVTDRDMTLDNFSVILSDTNAPNDRFFYRVQASQSSATQ